ncbi:MAG: hypothetical protein ACJ715_07405, partial [Ornithinibacter sp.]
MSLTVSSPAPAPALAPGPAVAPAPAVAPGPVLGAPVLRAPAPSASTTVPSKGLLPTPRLELSVGTAVA